MFSVKNEFRTVDAIEKRKVVSLQRYLFAFQSNGMSFGFISEVGFDFMINVLTLRHNF